MKGKIIIPGGSGFLGRSLAKWLHKQDYEVIILSRKSRSLDYAESVLWDGETLGDWVQVLEGAIAIVNLTGRWVNCRYHKRNRDEIINSRVRSTRIINEALSQCKHPPPVWLNSSTATIYLHRYDKPNDEENGIIASHPDAKDVFSVHVAETWEKEFEKVNPSLTRKILMRTSFVYGAEHGGVYETLRKLVKLRFGGKMGDGKQYVSWIHSNDFCRSVQWLIENENAKGTYNICTPNPLPNKEIMRLIRKVLKVSMGINLSYWMLELGAFLIRTQTELIIKSRYVIPARLMAEGFQFAHPYFEEAIRDIESRGIIR